MRDFPLLHRSAPAAFFLMLLSSVSLLMAQPGEAQVYGAWGVECYSENRTTKCVATQMVATDPEGRNVALGVILEPGQPGGLPLLTFRFTNQAFLPAGAGLKIDEHEPYRAPIAACDEAVCEVRAELAEEMAERMRTGNMLVFAFFLDRDNQISFPVSLNGFTRALAAVAGN